MKKIQINTYHIMVYTSWYIYYIYKNNVIKNKIL